VIVDSILIPQGIRESMAPESSEEVSLRGLKRCKVGKDNAGPRSTVRPRPGPGRNRRRGTGAAEPATVGDLRRRLAQDHPRLAALLERSALAVNEDFADEEVTITPDAEIALLPPVSGG